MSEQEEFEFRLRLERERQKPPSKTEMFKRELLGFPLVSVARGVKDVIDTGAEGLATLYDKVRGPTMSGMIAGGEADRVRAMNQAGKAEFDEATKGQVLPKVGRVIGNLAATVPAMNALGAGVGSIAPRLGSAIQTGGMATGAAPVGAAAKAVDLGIRATGGAVAGGASAGMVNPEDVKTGAAVGGAIPLVGPVVKAGAAAAKEALGATTGVGGKAISQAFEAGRQGGKAADDFASAMRGGQAMDDVLAGARANVDAMRQSKQAAYRSGMVDVSKDKTVLSLDGIRKAVADAADSLSFNGVAKDPRAARAVDEARKEVQRWAIKPADQFHTPEGLDALKQRIGSIIESLPMEQRNARRAVQSVYDSVKSEITKQAPGYAKVMDDYSKASQLITEVEKSLLGGQKATADASMRKLQSLMRNNVNTSYGHRDELAQLMIGQGGNDIMPSLAGQSMNSWVPRGIQRATAGGGGATLAALGQLPAAAALAAVSSPRLVGESAYLMGRAATPFERLLGQSVRAAPVIAAQE